MPPEGPPPLPVQPQTITPPVEAQPQTVSKPMPEAPVASAVSPESIGTNRPPQMQDKYRMEEIRSRLGMGAEKKAELPPIPKTPHEILRVAPGASEDDIESAFKKLSVKYHPDKNPGNPQAEEWMKAMGNAKDMLLHPEKMRESQAEATSSRAGATYTRSEGSKSAEWARQEATLKAEREKNEIEQWLFNAPYFFWEQQLGSGNPVNQEKIQSFQQTINTQKQELKKLLSSGEYQEFLSEFEKIGIQRKKRSAEKGVKEIERRIGNLQLELRPSPHKPDLIEKVFSFYERFDKNERMHKENTVRRLEQARIELAQLEMRKSEFEKIIADTTVFA